MAFVTPICFGRGTLGRKVKPGEESGLSPPGVPISGWVACLYVRLEASK